MVAKNIESNYLVNQDYLTSQYYETEPYCPNFINDSIGNTLKTQCNQMVKPEMKYRDSHFTAAPAEEVTVMEA